MVQLPCIHRRKKGHLQLINHKKRTHQCKRGQQREHVTNFNFLNKKKKRALSFQTI